jgi:hypothetical protein
MIGKLWLTAKVKTQFKTPEMDNAFPLTCMAKRGRDKA